jgi:nicotinamide-nucleotide amidase
VRARIVAVGSELLTPFHVDTNSLAITERLNDIGCQVVGKAVVGDDVVEIRRLVEAAIGAVEVLVVTGGLGPTEDDVTREAVAHALGLPLEIEEAIVDRIRRRFAMRGLAMPEINRRQAMVPRGAYVLENANGTAPGLCVEREGTLMVLLPGPPREMTPMLEAVIRDRLAPASGGMTLARRVVKVAGMTESDVDTVAQPVYGRWTSAGVPIETTILATLGQIELHLTARAADRAEADRALGTAASELQAVLGHAVISVDGRSLEAVVGDLLRAAFWRVAVAESCTGGLLTSRLTDVPGSSDYVDRAAVCYSNRAKTAWLGVPSTLIAEHGAVSEAVARAMAEGVRAEAGTEVGIGVTGIAGPGGGSAEKPVGTVAIAVVSDRETRVRTFRFVGAREQVKDQAVRAALNLVRRMLLGV